MKTGLPLIKAGGKALSRLTCLVFSLLCSSALFAQDDQDLVLYNSGVTKARAGQMDAAIIDFTESIKLAEKELNVNPRTVPKDYTLPKESKLAKAYYYRASAKIATGDYDGAVADIDIATKYDINYKEAYILRGNLCNDLGRYDDARKNLVIAVILIPDNADLLYQLGVANFNIGNHEGVAFDKKITEEAAENLTRSLKIKPDFVKALIQRAQCNIKLQKYDEAKADLDKVYSLDKKNADVHYFRGLIYRLDEDFESAIKEYSEAIALDPTNSTAYYNRGIAYSNMDEHQKSVNDFTKAIELYPKDDKAYLNRGIELLILDKLDEACQDFRRARELNNDAAQKQQAKLESICKK